MIVKFNFMKLFQPSLIKISLNFSVTIIWNIVKPSHSVYIVGFYILELYATNFVFPLPIITRTLPGRPDQMLVELTSVKFWPSDSFGSQDWKPYLGFLSLYWIILDIN